jgi:hypothetical protein
MSDSGLAQCPPLVLKPSQVQFKVDRYKVLDLDEP